MSGAKVAGMPKNKVPMPPDQRPASSDDKRFSITLDPVSLDQVEFIAKLWNAIDAARKVKRYREWGVSNVGPHLIRASLAGTLTQMGGYPASDEDQERYVAEVVARIEEEKLKAK